MILIDRGRLSGRQRIESISTVPGKHISVTLPSKVCHVRSGGESSESTSAIGESAQAGIGRKIESAATECPVAAASVEYNIAVEKASWYTECLVVVDIRGRCPRNDRGSGDLQQV